MTAHTIDTITLDSATVRWRDERITHEKNQAIDALCHAGYFSPQGIGDGPYKITMGIIDNRLVFNISAKEDTAPVKITISVSSLRRTIKDYFIICESYNDAISISDPSKVEAIDMGRRGVHNDGAEQLITLLKDKIEIDFETARRLFTLICVLHLK